MNFYTNFQMLGSTLFLRGVRGGTRIKQKIDIQPKLYLKSPNPCINKTVYGENLEEFQFSDIKEAREFMNDQSSLGNQVFGFNRWHYSAINDLYPGTEGIEYDPKLINVVFIDIETECENAFPNIEKADQVINAVTFYKNGKTYTLGLQPIETIHENNTYVCCHTEYELLEKFIKLWNHLDPDIVSGWNVDRFDLPYLVGRIDRILGKNTSNKLSPWGKTQRKSVTVMGKQQTVAEISGVCVLDFLDIYKKFKMKMQESYKLDYICEQELGEKKEDYSEYGTLHELYKNNYELFIKYNIKDTILVAKLEQKLKYISLAMVIAYFSKTNYDDVFSNVRIWDVVINNFLVAQNIQVHCTSDEDTSNSDEQYEGAYVKVPKLGLVKWACSFDLTSLYPNLIRTFNISPDVDIKKTIVDPEFLMKVAEEHPELKQNCSELIKMQIREVDADTVVYNENFMNIVQPILKKTNLTMASNGTLYSTEKQGFLSVLMGQYFDYRKKAKRQMLETEREVQKIKSILKQRGVEL